MIHEIGRTAGFGRGKGIPENEQMRRYAERLAAQLRAGMTVLNDSGLPYLLQSLPFRGLGLPRLGRIHPPARPRPGPDPHARPTHPLPPDHRL